jgi:hypothetical protein
VISDYQLCSTQKIGRRISTCTYCDLSRGANSRIDHVTVSGDLLNLCTEIEPRHLAINPSRHSTVTVGIKIALRGIQAQRKRARVVSPIEGHKAKPFVEQYQRELDQGLSGAGGPGRGVMPGCGLQRPGASPRAGRMVRSVDRNCSPGGPRVPTQALERASILRMERRGARVQGGMSVLVVSMGAVTKE